MNITKFTQKSVEILNSLEKIAYDFGAQEIVQEHLLKGMLTVEDSLLKKLIEKMEIDSDVFLAQVEGLVRKRPQVSGGQVFIGDQLIKVNLTLRVSSVSATSGSTGRDFFRHCRRSGETRRSPQTIQKQCTTA